VSEELISGISGIRMGIGSEEVQNATSSNIAVALVQTDPVLSESIFFFNETSFLAAISIRQKSSARPPRHQYIPQGPNVNDDTTLKSETG